MSGRKKWGPAATAAVSALERRDYVRALAGLARNRLAGRTGFSFKAWVAGKKAKQAASRAATTAPLQASQRITRYRLQNAATGGAQWLTGAQVRRIESKAAREAVRLGRPELVTEAHRALAGMRVRGRKGVLYPHLVEGNADG